MRLVTLMLLLFAVPASAGGEEDTLLVRNVEHGYELRRASIDWRLLPKAEPPSKTRTHLRAYLADSEPTASAEILIFDVPLTPSLVALPLADLAANWASTYEGTLVDPRERKTSLQALGGAASHTAELRAGTKEAPVRVTWTLARQRARAIVFYVARYNAYTDDAEIETEIATIRDSFRFLQTDEAAPTPPPPPAPPKTDPELLEEKRLSSEPFLFECVKPEGLLELPPEADRDVIFKFEGRKEQAYLVLRVYAVTSAKKRWTLNQLIESVVESFEETYGGPGASRKDPLFDTKYKFPLAKQAVRIDLVGRLTTQERTTWLFAECRNGCQYRLQVFASGTSDEAVWKREIAEFQEGFRPLSKKP